MDAGREESCWDFNSQFPDRVADRFINRTLRCYEHVKHQQGHGIQLGDSNSCVCRCCRHIASANDDGYWSMTVDPLQVLYREMAAFTKPVCDAGCEQFAGNSYRCCERKYCELARIFAREKYGVTLIDTGHPLLPFMGEAGCVVEPHLRPICALHACPVSYGRGLDAEAMKRYFSLRHSILTEAAAQHRMPTFE